MNHPGVRHQVHEHPINDWAINQVRKMVQRYRPSARIQLKKLVFIHEGNFTIARAVFLNKRTKKSTEYFATAKKGPRDTFNFKVAREVSLARVTKIALGVNQE